jgi:hypothetical protein
MIDEDPRYRRTWNNATGYYITVSPHESAHSWHSLRDSYGTLTPPGLQAPHL